MTFDQIDNDGFSSTYFKKSEPEPAVKSGYWKAAFGLQEVDGLVPSDYARSLAEKNVQGEMTLAEVGQALDEYHSVKQALPNRTDEADKVSQRIVKLLSDGWFDLSASMLTYIHGELFKDLEDVTYQPGRYKDDLYFKLEPILNGDSVMYAAPGSIDAYLDTAFRHEQQYRYDLVPGSRSYLSWADANNYADFISKVWSAHPFMEGNTRTVAVFAELYLRELGIDVDNTLFENESSFFRNALVRASYANLKVGVTRTCEPLLAFLTKLVEDPDIELDQRTLWCRPLFEHPEAVRNVSRADAKPLQDELLQAGIAARVLTEAR